MNSAERFLKHLVIGTGKGGRIGHSLNDHPLKLFLDIVDKFLRQFSELFGDDHVLNCREMTGDVSLDPVGNLRLVIGYFLERNSTGRFEMITLCFPGEFLELDKLRRMGPHLDRPAEGAESYLHRPDRIEIVQDLYPLTAGEQTADLMPI